MGYALGGEAIRRIAGDRIKHASKALRREGVLAMAAVRIIPVAPYTLVNVAAAGRRISSFATIMIGTFLGMTPGVLAMIVFVDQLWSVIRNPNITQIGVAATVMLSLWVGTILLRRWLRKRGRGNACQLLN